MRILVFGDSITQGYWDTEYGGWVQRLRKECDKQSVKHLKNEWPEFFNLGVDGDTTSGVTKRLALEIEHRRYVGSPFVCIFAIGLNDTLFSANEVASTPEQYGDELDALYAAAGHYSDKIMFVGLTPVDDKLCNPFAYSSSGKSYKNDRVLNFEEVLRKFCAKNKITHVQIFEKFQERQKQENLLADGLHPNDAGHQLIADLIKPQLDLLLLSHLT